LAFTKRLKDKAWAQLGTSGSGNHFVELGELTVLAPVLGLETGTYLALLSHSGSRGTGGDVATHYSRLAQETHAELPKDLAHLAWLDLDSEAGQEYWAAMELMGRYAAASHELIHRHVREAIGCRLLADLENHHNFAWREEHIVDGATRTLIVHRKGATPAGHGVLGIIPGSMGTPGYLVRGLGEPSSLCSASRPPTSRPPTSRPPTSRPPTSRPPTSRRWTLLALAAPRAPARSRTATAPARAWRRAQAGSGASVPPPLRWQTTPATASTTTAMASSTTARVRESAPVAT